MWLGNSSKYRIINEIKNKTNLSILDFGAGTGKNWISILEKNPSLNVCLFEPDPVVHKELLLNVSKMGGTSTASVSDDLNALGEFDYIISFSVFEHVSDPAAYLRDAKKHLKKGGKFFLNYDDGHFQHWVDLGNVRTWRAGLSGLLARVMAPLGRLRGRTSLDLNRHTEAEILSMITAAGFVVSNKRYENTISFKQLYKHVPASEQIAFMEAWVSCEDTLNKMNGQNNWLKKSSYSITLELTA